MNVTNVNATRNTIEALVKHGLNAKIESNARTDTLSVQIIDKSVLLDEESLEDLRMIQPVILMTIQLRMAKV